MPPAWLRIAGGNPHLLMTARSAVEGNGTAQGPSTMLRMVPLPSKSRGGFYCAGLIVGPITGLPSRHAIGEM